MIKQITILIIGSFISVSTFGQQYNSIKNKKIQEVVNIRGLLLKNKLSKLLKTDPVQKEKLDSVIMYNFNDITNTWDKKYIRETYKYDKKLKDTLWVYSTWIKEKNSWKDLLKEELHYDAQGNIDRYSLYSWWDDNNSWSGLSRVDYTYDEENQLTEYLGFGWKNSLNDWVEITNKKYSYDSNGHVVKDSTYAWSINTEQWRLKEKTENEYIADKLRNAIIFDWDVAASQWIYSTKEWYNHDFADVDLIAKYSYVWDVSIVDWKMNKREGFAYTDQGYADAYNMASRDLDNGDEWNYIQTDRYSFDYTINYDELALPYSVENYYELFFHHKVTGKNLYTYNFETQKEEQYRNLQYYYSPAGLLEVPDSELKTLMVYPNPARDHFNISLPTNYKEGVFELFDMKGSVLLTTTFADESNINVDFLESGMYVYHITLGTKKERGKLAVY